MLQVADLITPKGILEPSLFPRKTRALSLQELQTRVQGALEEGEKAAVTVLQARRDDAVRAFVYWRIYFAVCQEMHRSPNDTKTDSGKTSVAFTDAQRAEFVRLRDGFEAEFKDFLPVDVIEPKKRSISIPLKVKW